MLTIGKHNCTVLPPNNGWYAESKNGTPSIRLNLRVTDGESEGETLEHHLYLTDKTRDKNIGNLCAIFGWDGDLKALAGMVDDGPFVGKPCRIVTEEEEYQGKKRVRVKWLNGPGTPGLPPDKALALAKRLMGTASAPLPKTPAPARRPAPDPDLDPDLSPDAIPFNHEERVPR